MFGIRIHLSSLYQAGGHCTWRCFTQVPGNDCWGAYLMKSYRNLNTPKAEVGIGLMMPAHHSFWCDSHFWILLLLVIVLPQGTVLKIQVQSWWKGLADRLLQEFMCSFVCILFEPVFQDKCLSRWSFGLGCKPLCIYVAMKKVYNSLRDRIHPLILYFPSPDLFLT